MLGLLSDKVCGTNRRCLCYAAVLLIGVPLVVIGSMIGIFYPNAPDIHATTTTINGMTLNGQKSVGVDLDLGLEIFNKNRFDLAFDNMNVTFFFPSNPDTPVGKGELEGGVIAAGEKAERKLHAIFDVPWALAGVNFLMDMQRGASSLIVRGDILGFSTIVKTQFRLASKLECLVTYHYNDKSTSRECQNKGKASIVMRT